MPILESIAILNSAAKSVGLRAGTIVVDITKCNHKNTRQEGFEEVDWLRPKHLALQLMVGFVWQLVFLEPKHRSNHLV